MGNGALLCLECAEKFDRLVAGQDIRLKEQHNLLVEHMESLTGVYGVTPKYDLSKPPVIKTGPINRGPVTFNNISVNSSVVGAINTGEVQKIDVALSQIGELGNPELQNALARFTEAIIASTAANEVKTELLQQMAVLSSEAGLPKDQRKGGVIKALLTNLGTTAKTFSDLAAAWEKLKPIVTSFFGP